MLKDFFAGITDLLAGLGLWRSHRRLMTTALLPALGVLLVWGGLLFWLGSWLISLVPGWTGFAEDWPGWLSGILRFAIDAGLVAALVVTFAVTYTAITLAVGDPFYGKISLATDELLGGPVPDHSPGGPTWLVDTLSMAGLGLIIGIGAAAVSLLPGVGGGLATLVGFVGSSWALAAGLTVNSLERRGYDRHARLRLWLARPGRLLGFGLIVQLLFLIPLGAVLVMPAAASAGTRAGRALAAGRQGSGNSPSGTF
ncbi:MAG: EI24 domain-containing protein [Propionicimonas sp.]|uniref:EI24 domain-containing protein n=1 Tax=Propionicimonas sp. TaxID=1955623 RepID=UPI002B1EBB4A|nr:EI24 domain-containing protein [Propionicimonas sp.]MEA4942964.1 EI24 domain-containing protein [Propionicimonas sp.]MEA5055489.1 EI24 domain-containing protein [Propionicimonas sp.]